MQTKYLCAFITSEIRGKLAPLNSFKNSEYDQEIPQSQTADNSMAPRGKATQPSRDTS